MLVFSIFVVSVVYRNNENFKMHHGREINQFGAFLPKANPRVCGVFIHLSQSALVLRDLSICFVSLSNENFSIHFTYKGGPAGGWVEPGFAVCCCPGG